MMMLITMKMMMMIMMTMLMICGDQYEFYDEKENEIMMMMALIRNLEVGHMSIFPCFRIVSMKMLYQSGTCSPKLRCNIMAIVML